MTCTQPSFFFQGSRATIACYCGLGRLDASDLAASLPKIQCIILDEDDPKVDRTIAEVRKIAEAGRLHSTVTVISVLRDTGTRTDSSDSDEASFDDRIDELGSFLVSLGVIYRSPSCVI